MLFFPRAGAALINSYGLREDFYCTYIRAQLYSLLSDSDSGFEIKPSALITRHAIELLIPSILT